MGIPSRAVARVIRSVLVLGPLLLASGCYATVAGVVAGIVLASGPGGGTSNPPQVPVIEDPVRLDGDHVLVRYFLVNGDADAVDLRFEWQPLAAGGAIDPSGTFCPATGEEEPVAGKTSEGTRLRVEPGKSADHLFIWRAREDLGRILGKPLATVGFRITPFVGAAAGQGAVTATAFWAGNEPPRITSIFPGPDTGTVFNNLIPISIQIADSSSDPVRLEIGFRIGEHGPLRSWDRGEVTFRGEAADERFSTNTGHTLIWDSVRDIGTTSADIWFEIVPHDDLEPRKGEGEISHFAVDNNPKPVVEIFGGIAGAPDRSFDLSIPFIVKDENRNPVTVVLEWAPVQSEEWKPLEEKAVSTRGRVDDSTDLEGNRIRVTEFARKGLVFTPPTLVAGERSAEEPPYTEEKGSRVFIVGQEIRLFEKGREGDHYRGRLTGFDPRDSVATLSGDLPRPLPATMFYEVKARRRLAGLSSTPGGTIYSFVWDSSEATRTTQNAIVRIRATGYDPDRGPTSLETVFRLENGAFASGPPLKVDPFSVSAAIANLDGDAGARNDIAVLDPEKSAVTVFIQGVTGELFQDPDRLSTGNKASAMAAGDVNGDGLADILVADEEGWVGIYLQKSGGSYSREPDWILDAGDKPVMIAGGDLNGDGKDDVVVANSAADSIGIYLQDDGGFVGGGTPSGSALRFRPCQVLPTDLHPGAVAIGYLDDDDRPDLAVACSTSPDDRKLMVFFQRSPGSEVPGTRPFAPDDPQLTLSLSPDKKPVSVAIGDVDGDGKNEIAVANQISGTISIFGRIPGAPRAFGLRRTIEVGPGPTWVGIGDLNGDRKDDLVVLDSMNEASVYFQDGGGGLQEIPTDFGVGAGPCWAAIGDLNGDGWKDLAVVNRYAETLSLLLQNHAGMILSSPSQVLGPNATLAEGQIGDLDGDGRSDVAAADIHGGVLAVYLQSPEGTLLETPIAIGAGPGKAVSLSIADFDGDGGNDLVAARGSPASGRSGGLSVFRRPAAGGLPAAETAETIDDAPGYEPVSMAAGDLDGDGENDVVVASAPAAGGSGTGGRIAVYSRDEGRAHLRVSGAPIELPAGHRPLSVKIADLDGDGRNDIVVASYQAGTDPRRVVALFVERSPGVYREAPGALVFEKNNELLIAAGDISDDGRIDLVVADLTTLNGFRLEEGGASASLGSVTLGQIMNSVAIGDVNGDGKDEVLAATTDSDISVLVLDRGKFVPNLRIQMVDPADCISVGDVNGDGGNDVVVTHTNGAVSVFLAR